MALDTFSRIANQIRLRAPDVDILLCQDAVNHAFRELSERRWWSWLVKFGQFISPGVTNAGTLTATTNSFTVTGSGTAWTTSLIGQQLRVGLGAPIYTVATVQSPTQLILDSAWGYVTVTNVGYQIYQAYYTVPFDFKGFISIWDPSLNWQLNLNSSQTDINQWDAQRASVGQTYAFVQRDYTTNYAGSISQPIQVVGSGPVPATTGAYNGAVNTIFTVQIALGGVSGSAKFQWSAGNGSFSPAILTNTYAITLQQGVQIYFPANVSYNTNDMFTIQCTAIPQIGLPRFEGWPHYQGPYRWPFLYTSRAPDLEDTNVVLPGNIRGDVLLEMALAEISETPGTSTRPNAYYNLGARDRHMARAERMIMQLELRDDDIFENDVNYSAYIGMPFAPFPFLDANYLQTHDVSLVGLY